MSKRPTIVKPASEGSKRIVMKAWNDLNSGIDKYEVDSIEQVLPCGSMLMEFENTRAEMDKQIGAKNLQSANLWISPPQEYFDRIINEGCASVLPLFNAFFCKDVHVAIRDGYHPYRVILCRVLLGKEGRDYEFKYGKYKMTKGCAIPSFIVTFTSSVEQVIAKANQKQKDEAYEQLVAGSNLAVAHENQVVENEPVAQPEQVQKMEGQKMCMGCGEFCEGSCKFCPNCGNKL